MSFLHTTIKINLIMLGYIKNYPPHLISDAEMCDGFLNKDHTFGYFLDNYPCIDESLRSQYDALVSSIDYYLNQCRSANDDSYIFPDWIYSYMLGGVISVKSDPHDIQYLADMLNLNVEYGDFSPILALNCYRVSQSWLKKLSVTSQDDQTSLRPPTIFGEPHVIKSLRLQYSQIGGA